MFSPLELNLKATPSDDTNKVSKIETINPNPIKLKFKIRTDKWLSTKNESQEMVEEIKSGKWSKEEHIKFLNACMNHGNNWFKVRINY